MVGLSVQFHKAMSDEGSQMMGKEDEIKMMRKRSSKFHFATHINMLHLRLKNTTVYKYILIGSSFMFMQ